MTDLHLEPPTRDVADPASSELAQHVALRTTAVLVDHADRDLWTFRGDGARATLAGLVTNDVIGLTAGHGCYAAALTAKGRIVADVRILAVDAPVGAPLGTGDWLDGAALLVDVPPRAAEGWGALVRKYVNPRATRYARVGEAVRAFGVYGARARDAVANAFGAAPSALAALPPYAHAVMTLADGATVLVTRVPDAGSPAHGLDGFLVLAPAPVRDWAWARVAAAVPGAVAGGDAAYQAARVEAGYPEWGVDIDDTTIPQEANFDELGAISYTKGCYTGQEVVARVHFRGHVNRHLRGLVAVDAADEGATDAPALATGATLSTEQGAAVGDVRSVARSPRAGTVALGMVRREVALGTPLRARWTDAGGVERTGEATVVALPFAPAPTAA